MLRLGFVVLADRYYVTLRSVTGSGIPLPAVCRLQRWCTVLRWLNFSAIFMARL